MRSTIATGTLRHRRLILGGGIGLSVVCSGMQLLVAPASFGWLALTLLPLVAAVAFMGLAGGFSSYPRLATFVVDLTDPAFRTLPDARQVYATVGASFLAAGQFGNAVAGVKRAATLGYPELRVMSLVTAAAIVPAVVLGACLVVSVWRDTLGVQLRTDGLVARFPLGTLIVPWEALAPGYPLLRSPWARSLVLTYARPDLVRRRGLTFGRRRISADTVDPRFLGAAIAYYVAYPQCRAEIGTQAGYDRLRWVLTGQPPSGC